MNDRKETFRTPDLILAASLIAYGYKLVELQRMPNNLRMFFVFMDSDDLRVTVDEFYNDTLKISPRLFSQDLKKLKNDIFNYQK